MYLWITQRAAFVARKQDWTSECPRQLLSRTIGMARSHILREKLVSREAHRGWVCWVKNWETRINMLRYGVRRRPIFTMRDRCFEMKQKLCGWWTCFWKWKWTDHWWGNVLHAKGKIALCGQKCGAQNIIIMCFVRFERVEGGAVAGLNIIFSQGEGEKRAPSPFLPAPSPSAVVSARPNFPPAPRSAPGSPRMAAIAP